MTKNEVTKFIKEHKDEIIKMRLDGYEYSQIGEKYNLNPGTVGNWLKRNGIEIPRKTKNPNIITKVIHMYTIDKMTTREIADCVNIGSTTVCNILKDNNIERRPITEFNKKYSLNEKYFDKIDTPNKAYILGLLYADGNVSKKGYVISLGLQEKDRHILETIRKELQYDKPLVFIDNSKRKGSVQNTYLLRIHNKYMVSSLNKIGMVPCKSHILKFPSWLDHDLISHFIRGYLDGDGSIIKDPKNKHVNFIGSESMMDDLKEFIENELGIHCSIYYHPNKINKIIQIGGGIQVKKLLDYLYKDAEMYLHRKYEIYENLYVKPFINNSQIA